MTCFASIPSQSFIGPVKMGKMGNPAKDDLVKLYKSMEGSLWMHVAHWIVSDWPDVLYGIRGLVVNPSSEGRAWYDICLCKVGMDPA